jgi:hypothetical protein
VCFVLLPFPLGEGDGGWGGEQRALARAGTDFAGICLGTAEVRHRSIPPVVS